MMILQTSFKYCPLYKSSYDRGLYSIEHIELHTFQRCAELKLVGDGSQNFNVGQYDLLSLATTHGLKDCQIHRKLLPKESSILPVVEVWRSNFPPGNTVLKAL